MTCVLIVDDDDFMRRVLRTHFERAGHEVVEADSADAAIALVEAGPPPDAVVSDVLMPGTDGLTFYQHLMATAPSLRGRVVFLTGANREPSVRDPIEALGVPLLGKLDDLQLVVDAIRIQLIRPRG
jgi:CheY-like chemotaxis protein